MIRSRSLAVLGLLAAVLPAALNGQSLSLHLQPASSAPVIGSVDASDPAVVAGLPVADRGLASAGWRQVRHAGTFTGYVARRSITKDMNVAPGTPVRVAADPAAGLLTVVAEGDVVEVVSPDLWAEIRITKTLPGFVLVPPAPPPPAPAPMATPQPVPQAILGPIYGPADAATAVAGQTRLLEGTLRETRSVPGFPRRFPYELLDKSGRPFAYVRLQDAVLAGTMLRYLGQTVTVYGQIGIENQELWVDARVVRPKGAIQPMP